MDEEISSCFNMAPKESVPRLKNERGMMIWLGEEMALKRTRANGAKVHKFATKNIHKHPDF